MTKYPSIKLFEAGQPVFVKRAQTRHSHWSGAVGGNAGKLLQPGDGATLNYSTKLSQGNISHIIGSRLDLYLKIS